MAFTDRHGGVSGGPFASLNLAIQGGDDPESVEENLRRVAAKFNANGPLVGMQQVHGSVTEVVADDSRTPVCDGLVTAAPGVALLVRVADCVPVLLADVEAGVVGAAHAGRKGVSSGVVSATVQRMRAQGASGSLVAWVGPHICGLCYEVPDAMREEVAAVVPAAHSTTSWGTPALDLGAAVAAQLTLLDVEVIDASRCTREHEDLYSFRRDGADAGRLAGLIRISP
ncbi:MAG TPA: peptidoglycan editing factor PgeF [Nocardioidaceae bacterium]|nr:peptidoglycan editing factor PgeF [Nocardioidaceae bacterium]